MKASITETVSYIYAILLKVSDKSLTVEEAAEMIRGLLV